MKDKKDFNHNDQEVKESKSDEFYNNQFMINWDENESPEHFAGDKQADNFTEENDYNKNLDMRMNTPMGGTFMHPMHDATLDPYSNKLSLDVEESKEEEK